MKIKISILMMTVMSLVLAGCNSKNVSGQTLSSLSAGGNADTISADTVDVFIVLRDLPEGTVLSLDDLAIKQVPKERINVDRCYVEHQLSEVLTKRLAIQIVQGEILTPTHLRP